MDTLYRPQPSAVSLLRPPFTGQMASPTAPAMPSTKSNKQSNTMTPALLLKLTNTSPRFVPAMPNTGRHI
ncbi:hypothetical protein BASA50_009180 [Batrachochytrium salamandrivorans]|uniref:Uncharacterized protein n=1 Tax=Batrachochytrium salamandrivorans TaxID=1357716 RepID=A0ABQ8F215_9FUNG|nr:hypothetical protein BASA50_009180 [Batrachochytrium salamandrivorans]